MSVVKRIQVRIVMWRYQ